MPSRRLRALLEKARSGRLARLLDSDGLPLESVGSLPEVDADRIARALSEQANAAASEEHPLTSGEMGRIVVMTDLYTVFLAPISERHRLLLILDAGGSDGRIRFELRRACRDLRATVT